MFFEKLGRVIYLASEIDKFPMTRAFRPEGNELEDDTNDVLKMVGVSKKYEVTFPNIEMNTVCRT